MNRAHNFILELIPYVFPRYHNDIGLIREEICEIEIGKL